VCACLWETCSWETCIHILPCLFTHIYISVLPCLWETSLWETCLWEDVYACLWETCIHILPCEFIHIYTSVLPGDMDVHVYMFVGHMFFGRRIYKYSHVSLYTYTYPYSLGIWMCLYTCLWETRIHILPCEFIHIYISVLPGNMDVYMRTCVWETRIHIPPCEFIHIYMSVLPGSMDVCVCMFVGDMYTHTPMRVYTHIHIRTSLHIYTSVLPVSMDVHMCINKHGSIHHNAMPCEFIHLYTSRGVYTIILCLSHVLCIHRGSVQECIPFAHGSTPFAHGSVSHLCIHRPMIVVMCIHRHRQLLSYICNVTYLCVCVTHECV